MRIESINDKINRIIAKEEKNKESTSNHHKYRIRSADNGIQHFVEEDINFILSSVNEADIDYKIIKVLYSKTKANKAMYRLIAKEEGK